MTEVIAEVIAKTIAATKPQERKKRGWVLLVLCWLSVSQSVWSSPSESGALADSDLIANIDMTSVRKVVGHRWVLQPVDVANAPYIIQGASNTQHFESGDYIYIQGKFKQTQKRYSIVQRQVTYLDPMTNELLGLEMAAIGQADLVSADRKTAVLKITSSKQAISVGDQLIPIDWQLTLNKSALPIRPEQSFSGKIIGSVGSVSINRHDVIAISGGIREGIPKDSLLAIRKEAGQSAASVGLVVILAVFEKMSYGVVLRTSGLVAVGDHVCTAKGCASG